MKKRITSQGPIYPLSDIGANLISNMKKGEINIIAYTSDKWQRYKKGLFKNAWIEK